MVMVKSMVLLILKKKKLRSVLDKMSEAVIQARESIA